jgi:hypothetical protein
MQFNGKFFVILGTVMLILTNTTSLVLYLRQQAEVKETPRRDRYRIKTTDSKFLALNKLDKNKYLTTTIDSNEALVFDLEADTNALFPKITFIEDLKSPYNLIKNYLDIEVDNSYTDPDGNYVEKKQKRKITLLTITDKDNEKHIVNVRRNNPSIIKMDTVIDDKNFLDFSVELIRDV